ncbi:unnamed protein product [Mytilus coruscus]|uniref:SUEL-type lectin domain-containing protein n=1 Tax=Mytilus coruscus TaxID=42192 RepID=A0A6J8EPX1_MYTCO|nr:unnamed protein product [Mytilus coruscus]
MVNDGKGFDSLVKCLCNNNDATMKDLPEKCTTEIGGQKDVKIKKRSTLRKNKENEDKQRKTEKDSENSDKTTYSDKTTNERNRDRKDSRDRKDRRDRKEHLCQGKTLNITCQNDFVIVFDDANFGRGRSDSERCSHYFGSEGSPCDNHKQTLQVLNDKCHEQKKCFLPVNKDIFGNPCSGVTKYLYVKYHCKRKVNHDLKNANNTTNIDETTYDGKGNDRWDDKKDRWDRKDHRKKHFFKVGAIVGISVGVTCTIILVLVILAIIFVCRRRSRKKKRKQLTRLQSIDQRFEMAHLESSPSNTNTNILSTNQSLNTDEAQGEYFVLDPSITKYDIDLSNRKLPEIKRFSGVEGNEDVYYEIDEDKIKSSTDMEGVHQKQLEEVWNQGSHHSYPTKNQTQLGSKKKNTDQLITLQSVGQRTEMANLESSPSSTNKGVNTILSANIFLNIDEAQGEYFVLDPSMTKYDKDLVLPEVKRISVAQGDEKVYNEHDEIDEDKIESLTDMKVDHQKQIEEVRDIAIYHTDLTNNQNQLGFGNTTYNVTSAVDDLIY